MKRLLLALAMIGIFAATTIAAENYALKARVPFDFSAAGVQVSAGVYTIERQGAPGILMIRDDNGHIKAVFQTITVSPARDNDEARLVFNKYGDQYFLSRVINVVGPGAELRKSKIERELVASAPVQQVMLAASYR